MTKNNNTELIGKMPPQVIDIEKAVLGALMLEKDSFLNIGDILVSTDFYKEQNKLVFEAINSLHVDSMNVDMLTVSEELIKRGKLEEVGGRFYITQLTANVASASHIQQHARIIKEKSIARSLIYFSSELNRIAYNDLDEAVDYARNEMFKLLQNINKKNASNWMDVIAKSLKSIHQNVKIKNEGGQTGIPTGLTELDNFTGGWQNTNLVIFAGRPGIGKTSMMLNMVKCALVNNFKTLLFSLEMSEEQLSQKLIGSCGISPRKMRSGELNKEELEQIEYNVGAIENWPLFINDDAATTIGQLEAETEREVLKSGISIVFIDYLQLINNSYGTNEQEKIANMSRRLKALAKRCNIPIIALSQLNRDATGRLPSISDLRGSGAIEQDADDILFIHRQWYYDQSDANNKGVGDMIFAKHRFGGTGNIRFRHNNIFTEFTDFSTVDKPF